MAQPGILLHFSPAGRSAPAGVYDFAARSGYTVVEETSSRNVLARLGRSYPAAVVLDGSDPAGETIQLCQEIKTDAFTAVVPVIIYSADSGPEAAATALEAGADEALTSDMADRESILRLTLALRRAERDVSVHPTTRLPGTVQIERDFAERLRRGELFAVCYADLDHFKEFNDRYGYGRGDRVILILSRILRDVVSAHSPTGFVGHIGGDDFIFSVPLADYKRCCDDVIEVFSELIPQQYSEEDRARGFYLGKDRRGNEYEVPLMTLSIGVVTNELRDLTHTAEISALATEMKSYAKTFPGSLYAVDRRGTGRADAADASAPGGPA